MKILHVIQNLDKEKGGGVTARNLKLIEYLEKKKNINYVLSLKSNINKNFNEAFIDKNRQFYLSYLNERFPLPIPNIFKIAKIAEMNNDFEKANELFKSIGIEYNRGEENE